MRCRKPHRRVCRLFSLQARLAIRSLADLIADRLQKMVCVSGLCRRSPDTDCPFMGPQAVRTPPRVTLKYQWPRNPYLPLDDFRSLKREFGSEIYFDGLTPSRALQSHPSESENEFERISRDRSIIEASVIIRSPIPPLRFVS